MALVIPNTIQNGIDADGARIQENFVAVRDHINNELLDRTGSVVATQPVSGVAPVAGARMTVFFAGVVIGFYTGLLLGGRS